MTAHDEYGASSAKRWTSCLGSVRLCSLCPPSADSEWGDEGRLAHELAGMLLMVRERNALQYVGAEKVGDLVGTVTQDMVRAVQIYLDYVYDILDRFPDAVLRVENRVKVPSTVVPNRMGGTYDARIYVPSLRLLIVIDYKHGAGIFVSEEDNLQMDMYAIASIFELNEAVETVTVTIVQPRSWQAGGAIRSADRPVAELLARHAWFEQRAALTLDPNAALTPTAENCRWCPAGGYGLCPAQDKTLLTAIDPSLTRVADINMVQLPDAKKMSVERMLFWLANEDKILALLKNIRMTATGWVRNGNEFPGYKMVLGQMERRWHGDRKVIAQTLCDMTGKTLDEIMPPTLITLTEAENLVVDMFRSRVIAETGETKKAHKLRLNEASQLAHEALAYLTLKEPRGAPRLVPVSDTRPALETGVPHFAGQINTEGL
jgi:hypothetical protein